MTKYRSCPNDGCDGEIAFEEEQTDNGGDGVWSSGNFSVWFYSEYGSCHTDGCPTLTPEQIETLEKNINDEPYTYDDLEP